MKQGLMEVDEYINSRGNGFDNRSRLDREWRVNASIVAKNTFNPIRNILETIDITPHPQKKMISLSIGDPTTFGNLKPSKVVVDAVKDSLEAGLNNGYGPSTGFLPAREAVAKH